VDGEWVGVTVFETPLEQKAYTLDMSWPALRKEIGIRTTNVLRRAELPDDLFARPAARLETTAYFRFWEALRAEAGDDLFPLRLYGVLRSESFSPPLFAALQSEPADRCLAGVPRIPWRPSHRGFWADLN
jgi:Arabinose-binding domain of AraC transcription regulator, N-term